MKKKLCSLLVPLMLVALLAACSSDQTTPEETTPVDTGLNVEESLGYFDYASEIAAYNAKSVDYTVPAAADIGLQVSDAQNVTGVVLNSAHDTANTTDYYLNALAAGDELTFTGDIQSATDTRDGTETPLEVTDGTFTITPATLSAADMKDEVITVTMTDGAIYNIHTVHELFPTFELEIGSPDAGVYSFAIDKFLYQVNTAGELVYYRNVDHLAGMVENFAPQDTEDGLFYTYFIELNVAMRNAIGGFSSGMYVVMNDQFQEVNYVTLEPYQNETRGHGEGYLDQHEMYMLGENHWFNLSYAPVYVDNLPEGMGIDGGTGAYVQAGIVQEVLDGTVVHEYNTIDYPIFYETAMERTDYETSSGDGTADDYMDYVHINSVRVDPADNNVVMSMRNQYAVYKFDRETGELIWTLGGTNNQFSGLDEVIDADGNLFIGQHYAEYVDAALAGNDSTLSVFDNHTDTEQNLTRTIEFVLDEDAMTATATVIQASDLDAMNGKNHWATHCGSVEYQSATSVTIGWGQNFVIDPEPDLQPTHPVFTDYNPTAASIEFELSVDRNPIIEAISEDNCFCYRVYKSAEA